MIINKSRRKHLQYRMLMRGAYDAVSRSSLLDASTGDIHYLDSNADVVVAAGTLLNHPTFGMVNVPAIEQISIRSENPSTWTTSTYNIFAVTGLGVEGAVNGPFTEVEISNLSGAGGRAYIPADLGIGVNAAKLYFCLRYRAGTSGEVRLTMRDSTNGGLESHCSGVVGAVKVTSTDAGAVTIYSDELKDGTNYYELKGCVEFDNYDQRVLGVGSNVEGESVIVLGCDISTTMAILDFHPPELVISTPSRSGVVSLASTAMLAGDVFIEFDWTPWYGQHNLVGTFLECGNFVVGCKSGHGVYVTDGTNVAMLTGSMWKYGETKHVMISAGASQMRICVGGEESKTVPYAGTFSPTASLVFGSSSSQTHDTIENLKMSIFRPALVKQSWLQRAENRATNFNTTPWLPTADTMPHNGCPYPIGVGKWFTSDTWYDGVPYSGAYSDGRFVGFDVSMRTFLAAVANPLSVLYTTYVLAQTALPPVGEVGDDDYYAGRNQLVKAYYGQVCSVFVSYVLGTAVPYRSNDCASEVSDTAGVRLVDSLSSQHFQPGDMMWRSGHIAIITDTIADADGVITNIKYQESWPITNNPWRFLPDDTPDKNNWVSSYTPSDSWKVLHDGWFTAFEFDAFLADVQGSVEVPLQRKIYRAFNDIAWHNRNKAGRFLLPDYEADADARNQPINKTLLLDRGDFVPYWQFDSTKTSTVIGVDTTGEGQPVKFNIMDTTNLYPKELVIYKDGVFSSSTVCSAGDVITKEYPNSSDCGEYTAYCVLADDSLSEEVEFSVCSLNMYLPEVQPTYSTEEWRVSFDTSDNMKVIILEMSQPKDDFIRRFIYPTDKDRANGYVTVPAGWVKYDGYLLGVVLYAENKYGRLSRRGSIIRR